MSVQKCPTKNLRNHRKKSTKFHVVIPSISNQWIIFLHLGKIPGVVDPKAPQLATGYIVRWIWENNPSEKKPKTTRCIWIIWVFPKIGIPQNGWFIMENPIKMDDLGVPLFLETPILKIDCKKKSFEQTCSCLLDLFFSLPLKNLRISHGVLPGERIWSDARLGKNGWTMKRGTRWIGWKVFHQAGIYMQICLEHLFRGGFFLRLGLLDIPKKMVYVVYPKKCWVDISPSLELSTRVIFCLHFGSFFWEQKNVHHWWGFSPKEITQIDMPATLNKPGLNKMDVWWSTDVACNDLVRHPTDSQQPISLKSRCCNGIPWGEQRSTTTFTTFHENFDWFIKNPYNAYL